jgi:diguanylate cyclase
VTTHRVSDPPAPLKHVWLLGHQHYQRLYLKFWLMTSGVYALFLVLHWYGENAGLVSDGRSHFLRILIPVCLLAFYVAMRSGWSRRLSDPSMTASQMAFAIMMLGLGYLLVPQVRGIFLMILPMVLLFGAFTLPPERCRQLGWFAVAVLGVAMGFSVWLEWGRATLGVERVVFLASAVVLPIAAAMAGRLSAIRSQLRTQKHELKDALQSNILLAKQDTLTGLPNRRHALELMAYEEKRAARQQIPCCVCMLDIDHFKSVNDTFGHATGDDVLRRFAQAGGECLRTSDVLARWGGEEFMLFMPETSPSSGVMVVERMRNHLARPDVWQSLGPVKVTFSAGIAAHLPPEAMEATVSRADVALYQAKSQGRNCTVQA